MPTKAGPEQTKERPGFLWLRHSSQSGNRAMRCGCAPGFIAASGVHASGRHEEIRNHCGFRLRGFARRRAVGDAEPSSAIANARQRDGIDTSTDNRRVLH
jgi:hypothetical protein